jgi:hypothetical protein
MAKFIVPRKEMAQMGWPQPLIELVAQLADFAQTQSDLQQTQTDLGTAQQQLTELEADVTSIQADLSTLPLLIPPRALGGDGYTDEQVRDVIGAALTNGTGITITVSDAGDTITVASTVTAYTDEQARDAIGAALVAGTNVSITVNDGADTITIDGITTEAVQDIVGAFISASGTGLTVTYNDAGNAETISINVATAAEFRANTADKILDTDGVWSSADYVALTDAATVAVDMSTGFNFSLTIGGNRTLGAPSNTKNGQTGVIAITQDGTGSRTLAYHANWKFAGGTDPTLSTAAGAVDLLFYQVISSTSIYGVLVKAIA